MRIHTAEEACPNLTWINVRSEACSILKIVMRASAANGSRSISCESYANWERGHPNLIWINVFASGLQFYFFFEKESAMEWLGSNWIWLVLGIGALVLFASGRGGCGMSHGGHDHGQRGEGDSKDRSRATTEAPLSIGSEKGGAPASTAHAHGAKTANPGVLGAGHAGHGAAADQPGGRRHRHGC